MENKNKTKIYLQDFYIQLNTIYYNFNILLLQLVHKYLQTRVLQFIQYLYNILWAFGIPQCVFVKKNLRSLGFVFFVGLRMTQWRSKHVALTIYYFKIYEINRCVIDWHICVFYTYQYICVFYTYQYIFFIYLTSLWVNWLYKEWPKKMYTHFDMKNITL